MWDGGDNLKDEGPRLSGEEDWRIGTGYIKNKLYNKPGSRF
jgi:hypothetical protein